MLERALHLGSGESKFRGSGALSDPAGSTEAGEASPSKKWEAARETALLAMKYALFINGGAAVALLAFIGGIWSTRPEIYAVVALIVAIACFALGAFSAGWAAWVAYDVDQLEYLAMRIVEKGGASFRVRGEVYGILANESYARWRYWLIASFVLFALGVVASCVSFFVQLFVSGDQALTL